MHPAPPDAPRNVRKTPDRRASGRWYARRAPPARASCSPIARPCRRSPMPISTRPIRDTGVAVSEIGFGVWTVAAGWWGSFTRDEAAALIREAYDLGITFFNTSNAYG